MASPARAFLEYNQSPRFSSPRIFERVPPRRASAPEIAYTSTSTSRDEMAPLLVETDEESELDEFIASATVPQVPLDIDGQPTEPLPLRKSSTWATIFNTVNLFVGLGLLSKPFAFAKGGWLSVLVMGLACVVANYTGRIIVRCYFHMDALSHATFPMLGRRCYGKFGEWFVIAVVFIEFYGAVCMCLIFIWNNLADLRPDWSPLWISVISTACVIPTLLMRSFASMSWISFVGFTSSCCITLAIVLVMITDGPMEGINYSLWDSKHASMAAGIYILSLGGQTCLPAFYRNMQRPEDYNFMLNVSFSVMFVVYCFMGMGGYYVFGDQSMILVTSNLIDYPGGIINQVLAGLVVGSSFTSVAPMIAILSEIPEEMFEIHKGKYSTIVCIGVRVAFLAVGFVLSLFFYNYLQYLESVVGGVCTVATTFVFPCLFYLKLYEGHVSRSDMVLNVLVIVFGVLASVVVLVDSIVMLKEDQEDPEA